MTKRKSKTEKNVADQQNETGVATLDNPADVQVSPEATGETEPRTDAPAEAVVSNPGTDGAAAMVLPGDPLVEGQEWPRVVKVKPAALNLKEKNQVRSRINPELIQEYADLRKRGKTLPRIRAVWCPGESMPNVVWDGFHRAMGYGDKEDVEVELTQMGTLDDAAWMAASANADHGLRRSREEKNKAVRLAISLRPRASLRDLADHCGVSPETVRTIKQEIKDEKAAAAAAKGEKPADEPETVLGRDGREHAATKPARQKAEGEGQTIKADASQVNDQSADVPPNDPALLQDHAPAPETEAETGAAVEGAAEARVIRRLVDYLNGAARCFSALGQIHPYVGLLQEMKDWAVSRPQCPEDLKGEHSTEPKAEPQTEPAAAE